MLLTSSSGPDTPTPEIGLECLHYASQYAKYLSQNDTSCPHLSLYSTRCYNMVTNSCYLGSVYYPRTRYLIESLAQHHKVIFNILILQMRKLRLSCLPTFIQLIST